MAGGLWRLDQPSNIARGKLHIYFSSNMPTNRLAGSGHSAFRGISAGAIEPVLD